MKRSTVLYAVSALVIGGFLAYWFVPLGPAYSEANTIADGASNFKELAARFGDLAREKGGAYAFEVLKRAELPPNTDLHLLGHEVGNILYEQKGVDGIADCTQDFRNACSHAIVIGALNEFGGEAALPLISDACKKAPGGSGAYTMCYHGLGHGVFAFYSYDLSKTAEFCRKTGTPEYHEREYVECVGGSVMELMGGGGHDREAWLAAREKYLDPHSPLSPCMDSAVPERAKIMCLTYLTPRLWELAGIDMGNPSPHMFATAFSYCDAIPRSRPELRGACYGGFGKEFFPLVASRDIRDDVSYSDRQLSTVIDWCSFAGDVEGTYACVGDAVASAFWGGEKDPKTAFRLCGAADGTLQDACFERLADEVTMYMRGAEKDELCAQIPARLETKCSKSS
ncbi:MAG: Uncharacterized protein G01um10148_341 [Parcubacteria group bacterium Gr01-1014_8]|nr:MAG: Uncharacterized protein G01um10148_341 [Parcubacteria group bacterium Gr01-1014_8]